MKRKCLTCKRVLDVCERCGQDLEFQNDVYCLDCATELNNMGKKKKKTRRKDKKKQKKKKKK